MEEHQELFKFNPMDECEKIQDVAPYLMDERKENHNPILIMCEEALVETLLATTKTFGLYKVSRKNVFTNCQKNVIMKEAFKWLLKDGENGRMDWIKTKIFKPVFQKYF